MPAGPGPTGYVIPPASGTRAQQIMIYAADFAEMFGTSAGTEFTTFATTGPGRTYSAKQAADSFATLLAVRGLGSGIASGTAGLGSFLGAAVSASGPAAKNTLNRIPSGGLTGINAIGDFFSRLSNASTWIRIGEALLGLALIAIGVARITNAPANSLAGTVARYAAKGVSPIRRIA